MSGPESISQQVEQYGFENPISGATFNVGGQSLGRGVKPISSYLTMDNFITMQNSAAAVANFAAAYFIPEMNFNLALDGLTYAYQAWLPKEAPKYLHALGLALNFASVY